MRAPRLAHGLSGLIPRRLTTRIVLLLGFGLTLSLWVFSEYHFATRATRVRQESEQISHRYMRAQELLSTVGTQILVAAFYVRDGLLDPDPEAAAQYRHQLEDVLRRLNAELDRYEPVLGVDLDPRAIATLREEIDEFGRTVVDVLATHDARRPRDAREILRTRIMPRREGVVRLSEEVQALNRAAFVHQHQATVDLYRRLQRQTLTQFSLALAASFLIGLIATRHVERLEGTLRVQQQRDRETSHDLQRLSARLISAQEEERRAIARELHDEVGQVLTAVRVELAVAEQRLASTGGSPALLDDARAVTESAMHAVRDLSHLLHPTVLDDMGLSAAVEARVRDFRRRHQIGVDLQQEHMEGRLPTAVELAAYRIIQEALTNVVRHSGARRCQVSLQRTPTSLVVSVQDDGVGFVHSGARTDERRGLGLVSIHERASQLKGTVQIATGPNQGTHITVTIPLAEPPPPAHSQALGALPELTPVAEAVHA